MATISTVSEPQPVLQYSTASGKRTCILLGMLFWALASLPGSSQQNPEQTPPATLKVSTEVVNVYAVVADKKKHLIADLKKEDFELEEDGSTAGDPLLLA